MRVIVRILHVEEQEVERHEPDLLPELLEKRRVAPARLHLVLDPAAAPRAVDRVMHRGGRRVPGGPHRRRVGVHEVPVELAPGRVERAVRARQTASSTSSTRSRTAMRPSSPEVFTASSYIVTSLSSSIHLFSFVSPRLTKTLQFTYIIQLAVTYVMLE